MSKQRIQSILKCLEWINLLFICSTPYYYNSFNRLHLLCSSDIELNLWPTNLKMCHINIRSLSPVKLLAIQQEIADKYDIITLSETFLRQKSSHNLEIPSFHPIFRRDRRSHGGGVACFVSSNLVVTRRGDLESAGMECLWIEVGLNNNKFLLRTCYRPPDGNHIFWNELQYMIDLTYLGKLKTLSLLGISMQILLRPVGKSYCHSLILMHSSCTLLNQQELLKCHPAFLISLFQISQSLFKIQTLTHHY